MYILVRRTNPESIQYIGKAGYIGRRIDCKPKTADFDTGNYKRKGLVVNPYLVGEAAFKTNKKHTEAKKAWDSFRKKCVLLSSNDITNVNAQHREAYFLDEDKSSQHYGCVMFTSDWSKVPCCYIHGDYDLYDIVSTRHKNTNVVYPGELHGEAHNFGPYLNIVQNIVNSSGSGTMVFHGCQAKFSDHLDEAIDVFFPDGKKIITLENETAIREFDKIEFQNRQALPP